MVAPKHVRRAEEIKRLTKQLEDLRAARENMKKEKKATGASASPSPRDSRTTESSVMESSVAKASTPTSGSSFQPQKHAVGSRFLVISSFDSEESAPRILTIAGRLSELTTSQLLSTPSVLLNKPPKPGAVFLTRIPPNYSGDLVAIPGFDPLIKCTDPVVVLADADEISASKLPIADEDEVILIVDRDLSGRKFENTKFYAWDVGGVVKIGWAKEEPSSSEATCVGQVVFGTMEMAAELRNRRSCFEEENETYG